MNTHDMQDHVQQLLDASDEVRSVVAPSALQRRGMSAGLVVTMNDGSVFQLTIVQEA